MFAKLKFSVASVITLLDGKVTPGTVTVNAGLGKLLEFKLVLQMFELTAQLFEVQLRVAVTLTLLDPDEERESPYASEEKLNKAARAAPTNREDFLNLSLQTRSPLNEGHFNHQGSDLTTTRKISDIRHQSSQGTAKARNGFSHTM